MNNKYKLGMLAFGSLIDEPGQEISDIEINRIECLTPFEVEFSRISSSRDNAPTLIPIENASKGKGSKAVIIVIDDNISLEDAKSILWRRECHKSDKTLKFKDPKVATDKHVLIGELKNFCNVETVIYTYFLPQVKYPDLTPEKLADFAINSILANAGKEKKDGIRYLLSVKNFGIETTHSKEYERIILNKTNSGSLEEAIEKLDKKRECPDGFSASM